MTADKIKKRMLMVLDGSENSLEIVKYAAKISAFREMATVLFNVHSKIPEGYLDLERNGSAAWRVGEARIWEKEHDEIIQECMRKAKKILKVAGFPEDAVEIEIHNRKRGFARDIAREAETGYEGVLVGRKGMSDFKGLFLGSIATKLVEIVSFIPIIVVGKEPLTGSVLLALDGSENAMRGVAYVARVLGEADFSARLVHVIRSDNSEYVKEKKAAINAVFDEAKTTLAASGFNRNRITTRVITGARSRAAAVFQEAQEGGYGTIVVGRRGISHVTDFLMGRVTNKLIHLAKNQAVWVVN